MRKFSVFCMFCKLLQISGDNFKNRQFKMIWESCSSDELFSASLKLNDVVDDVLHLLLT